MEVRPGYLQTDIGEIPCDWDIAFLGDLISSLEAGVSVNSVEKGNDIYAHEGSILKTSAVNGGHFDPNQKKKIVPWDLSRAKQNPQKNSIIISRMNTPELVGECGYVDRDFPDVYLPDRLWMTKHATANPPVVKWLAYLLSFGLFNQSIKNSATGTSGSMKNISKPALFAVRIPLPSKEEQASIAEALSDADAHINSLEQLIAKKRLIKQGVMQELLSRKQRLPGFGGEWVTTKLGNLIHTLTDYTANGSFESLRNNVQYYYSENYAALVRTTDLGSEQFRPVRFTDKQGYDFLSKTALFGGEIVIANVGSIGKVFRVPYFNMPMTLAPNTYLLKFGQGIDQDYLYQWMRSNDFHTKLMEKIGSTTLQAINKDNLRDIHIRLPSTKEEQSRIAEILIVFDNEISALRTQLVKAKSIKQGMMQELLTGRIRLV